MLKMGLKVESEKLKITVKNYKLRTESKDKKSLKNKNNISLITLIFHF